MSGSAVLILIGVHGFINTRARSAEPRAAGLPPRRGFGSSSADLQVGIFVVPLRADPALRGQRNCGAAGIRAAARASRSTTSRQVPSAGSGQALAVRCHPDPALREKDLCSALVQWKRVSSIQCRDSPDRQRRRGRCIVKSHSCVVGRAGAHAGQNSVRFRSMRSTPWEALITQR